MTRRKHKTKQNKTKDMETIKVKKVTGPSGECAICSQYYRERYGMPLLALHGGEWVICSKDGEPSHAIGTGYSVEVVK